MQPRISRYVVLVILYLVAVIAGALLGTAAPDAPAIAPLDEGIGQHTWPTK